MLLFLSYTFFFFPIPCACNARAYVGACMKERKNKRDKEFDRLIDSSKPNELEVDVFSADHLE